MSLPSRRFRPPQEDGAALIDPPLSEVPAMIAANQVTGREFDSRSGFPSGYRQRAHLLTVGLAGGKPISRANINAEAPLILSGHQPELFHPGVWLKNFVLSSIAEKVKGNAINLIIDNDAVHSTAIRVPTDGDGWPQVVEVPFDAAGERIPWARRPIFDQVVFQNFPSEVHRLSHSVLHGASELLLDRIWPLVRAAEDSQIASRLSVREKYRLPIATDETKLLANLGECLAAGRHRLELDAGLTTREYPLSQVAYDSIFLTFVAHLLARHEELHVIHNQVLAEYRLQNGVRNAAHPVPDLIRDGDWYEAPFWIWSDTGPLRQRAFVRKTQKSWEISDRKVGKVPDWSASDNPGTDLIKAKMQILPRALITTMYARLVLSDLFIHGIGGAKYDEVTDEIIRRFFGIEPPRFLTATATFRLPIDRPQVTIEDVRENTERLRDARYRPESFVGDPLLASEPALARELAALGAEKKEYIARHSPRRSPREVFVGLDAINRAMHEKLRPVEEQLRREQARLAEELKAARVLSSREFSFVLFPEEYLVPRLLELSRLPA